MWRGDMKLFSQCVEVGRKEDGDRCFARALR